MQPPIARCRLHTKLNLLLHLRCLLTGQSPPIPEWLTGSSNNLCGLPFFFCLLLAFFIPSLAYSRKRKSIEFNLLDRFGHLAASGLALPPTLTSGRFPSTIISPYTSFLFDLFFDITLDDNKGDRLNYIRSFRLSFAVGCRSCLRSTNSLFATVERIPLRITRQRVIPTTRPMY